jgi:HK97 gp10 family phage protein
MATEFVQGMSELLRKLRELPKALENRIVNEALEAGAQPILDTAKALAPVDTGLLRESLKVVTAPVRKNSHLVRVGTEEGDYKGDAFYAAFHELGTTKMPARPYLRPAFDQNVNRAIEIISSEIGTAIEREATK